MAHRRTYTAPPASNYYARTPDKSASQPMMGWDTPSPLGAVIVTALSAGVVGLALGMILVASFAGSLS